MFARRQTSDSLSIPILCTALAVVFVCGLWVRLESWRSLSLCLFDEGVHAASVQQMMNEGPLEFDFAQPLHSPPLFPWMTAALAWVKGVFSPVDLIFVSIVMGALTPLAVFAIGRQIYGNGFGLAAAGLMAASDVHIATSRMGLPLTPMVMWFTLAIWSAAELAPRPLSRGATPRLLSYAFYGVMLGAFGSLAWTTQYSGGLLFVVLGVAAAIAWRWQSDDVEQRRPYMFVSGCLGAAIALASFVAWYWHVEREFPGGARAIFDNHLRQLQWFQWPQHVGRQLLALPALRHFGWLLTLGGIGFGGIWLSWRNSNWQRTTGLLATAIAVLVGVAAGTDALLLLCGAAGVIPAILSRRWPLILCAAWLTCLVVITPLSFPKVRLLSALMPPAILLSLAVVWPKTIGASSTSETDDHPEHPSAQPWFSLPWIAAGLLAAAGVAMLQPFGVTPTMEVWRQWSPRSGYAQFGERTAVETPTDAAVICQGQPALVVYCDREWRTLFGNLSFVRGLDGLNDDHPVFLAVDFRWLHETPSPAQQAIVQWMHCLEPVAVIPFQPSMAMLLEHLPPHLAALKAHTLPTESTWTDRNGRQSPAPPDIRSSGEDLIVLYRVDLAKIRQDRNADTIARNEPHESNP